MTKQKNREGFPSKLKIGGHMFEIKLVEKTALTDEECMGSCDLENSTISILETLPNSHRWATLIHESLHAVNWSMHEDMIESLSQQIYQLLADNDLFKH